MRIVKKSSGAVMKVTIFVIIIGILAVVAAVVFMNLYNDNYFADRKFEELSRKYFEDTLYEDFISEHDGEDLSEAFSKYHSGFKVKLRQVLNSEFLNNGQNYRSYFDTESYSCDTNTSYAVFRPRAPYGKKDYDAEFHLECSKI